MMKQKVVPMKKIDQIMQEMGFKQDAPDSVKEAFIKHLIRASTGIAVTTPSEKEASFQVIERVNFSTARKEKQSPTPQLAFDFFEEKQTRSEKKSS